MKPLAIGDHVVYSMPKISPNPGKHAHDVHPSMGGEFYDYIVEKFWTVTALPAAGQIEITTRRGKKRTLRSDDPRLRRASWLQNLLYRARFPSV